MGCDQHGWLRDWLVVFFTVRKKLGEDRRVEWVCLFFSFLFLHVHDSVQVSCMKYEATNKLLSPSVSSASSSSSSLPSFLLRM